jgi:hypothetical protein
VEQLGPELARGIEAPACGLQKATWPAPPDQETPDRTGESLDGSEESRFETVESSCAECEVVLLYNGYTLGDTGGSRGGVTSLT